MKNINIGSRGLLCVTLLSGVGLCSAQVENVKAEWNLLAFNSRSVLTGARSLGLYARMQPVPSVKSRLRYQLYSKLGDRATANTILILAPYDGPQPKGPVYWLAYRTQESTGMPVISSDVLSLPEASDAYVGLSEYTPRQVQLSLFVVDLEKPLAKSLPDTDPENQEQWLPEPQPVATQKFPVTSKLGCTMGKLILSPRAGAILVQAVGVPSGCASLVVEYDLNRKKWNSVEVKPVTPETPAP